MNKTLTIISIFGTLLTTNAYATPSFTICAGNCITDTSPFWTSTLYKMNHQTGQNESYKYDGIAIVANSTNDNLILFVKGYKGPGKYELLGAGSDEFASKPNALYSDDVTGTPIHIAPEKPENSYVEITEDKSGSISGNYRVTVRIDGKSKYDGIKLNGEFSGIQKKQ